MRIFPSKIKNIITIAILEVSFTSRFSLRLFQGGDMELGVISRILNLLK